jgi:hypothetical protein
MSSRSSGTVSSLVRQSVVVGLAALAVSMLAGCGDSQGPSGTTALSIMLKDAPGDLQKAFVTISEIDLVGSGGVQVLTQTPTTTDLLTLATTTATLVQAAEVPSGTYTELRFKITGACIAVDNGTQPSLIYTTTGYDPSPCGGAATGTLQSPSYAESGLKVTMAANALTITGTQKILLVDFDVNQSFGQDAGGSGSWVMHPVVTGGDIQATGSIRTAVQLGSGVTLPDVNNSPTTLAQFSAVLVAGASDTVGVVPLTDPDNDGTFTADFTFLNPATYTLSLKPPQGITSVTTTPTTPEAITVTSGQQTTAALTVTAAN